MHTTARLSILLGAGVLTAMVSAGPALAAGSANQPPPPRGNDNQVIGFFRTETDCDWAGRVGDAQNRWDDPHCNQVDAVALRGWWRLTADRNGNVSSAGFPGMGGHGRSDSDRGLAFVL